MQMVDDNVGNQVRQNAMQNDGNEVGQNAVQNPSIQNVENMNGLSVVSEISNQYGNENVVTAPTEGNDNGINGNLIRCYNCSKEEWFICQLCSSKSQRGTGCCLSSATTADCSRGRIRDPKASTRMLRSWAADAYEETERVKVKCTLEDTLQHASTSGTQSDNAPVYNSDGSTEVPKDENCYDHDIFNMLTHGSAVLLVYKLS
ncbi:gag-pol polyprotein [Tanacetum coccineum]